MLRKAVCHHLNSQRGQKLKQDTGGTEKHSCVTVLWYRKLLKLIFCISNEEQGLLYYWFLYTDYFISDIELVLFKIQNLCAFCLISSILKFKCILKATVAKKPWQDSDLHTKYLIENNLWLNWKIVSSSLHFSILIRFCFSLFQIHFPTKKYKRDTAPENTLHQPSPTEQRSQLTQHMNCTTPTTSDVTKAMSSPAQPMMDK